MIRYWLLRKEFSLYRKNDFINYYIVITDDIEYETKCIQIGFGEFCLMDEWCLYPIGNKWHTFFDVNKLDRYICASKEIIEEEYTKYCIKELAGL